MRNEKKEKVKKKNGAEGSRGEQRGAEAFKHHLVELPDHLRDNRKLKHIIEGQ